MDKVKLSPPWAEYVRKLEQLFKEDDQIIVEYNKKDADENKVIIKVDSTDKYEALINLLPTEKNFSGVVLNIDIIPSNTLKDSRYYIKKLFEGNKAVTRIENVQVASNPMTYIEFRKAVVQYYNDNLGDLNGNKSTLMENLARDVFEKSDGVFFCTNSGIWEEF